MSKNRVEWIDFVRAVAILTVLYIHATDGIFIISSDAIMNYTIYSRIFDFASLFIGRIGVPFFLMITGYLLLDRAYDDERVRKFWSKNCKGLIIVTVIWAIIYAISLQFITVGSSQVNVSEAGNLFFSHMWYMPMIIGMYLSMPFVSSALEVLSMHGIQNVNIQYCLGFSGGVYGIYIILGYLVKKGLFKKYSSKLMGLIVIVSFLICVLFQYYSFVKGYEFFLWYEFPFILTGSFALFELCSRMGKVRAFPLVSFLSKYSFAVFLVHNLFRLPLLPIVVELPFTEPVKAIILWILLIIFSYIAVVIIYRIPKFGKFILYMR